MNFLGKTFSEVWFEKFLPLFKGRPEVQNRFQEKILSANVTSNGDIAELSFHNLTEGKWYHLTGDIQIDVGVQSNVEFFNEAGGNGDIEGRNFSQDSGQCTSVSIKFKAKTTDLYTRGLSLDGSDVLRGDGTKTQTFLQIEELNGGEPVETTDFT